MKNLWYYETPLGKMGFVEDAGAIVRLYWGEHPAAPGETLAETPLLAEAGRQLAAYFAGACRDFTVPLAPEGTPFQQRVWRQLCAIPYGETRTYKQVAEAVGSPKAFRAVGMANHDNPIAILIPCHRVLGSSGKLTGYAYGLGVKQALLALEQTGAWRP